MNAVRHFAKFTDANLPQTSSLTNLHLVTSDITEVVEALDRRRHLAEHRLAPAEAAAHQPPPPQPDG